MISILLYGLVFVIVFVAKPIIAQTLDEDTYIGYSLQQRDDTDSVIYETADTTANVSTTDPPPDVYLNASVSVGEIDLTVQNLTATINLNAQVLELLQFNAGVDVSIDRVQILIQNITAKALLEVRLSNVVSMISDVLDSIDLNPILATLGQDVTSIVSTVTDAVTGATSTLSARSYQLANNILYSINNYSGNTHTNRILAQNGDIIDQSLDNDGNIYSQKLVGYYSRDMKFTGFNQSVTVSGQADRELEYVYAPFPGLSVVSAVYTDALGAVVGTQVLSESGGGGGSTVGGEL